jgi:hypothetical protein
VFATLECELFDQQSAGGVATRREAKLAVFDYLETFYNPRRRHSALGQIASAAFEARHTLATAAKASGCSYQVSMQAGQLHPRRVALPVPNLWPPPATTSPPPGRPGMARGQLPQALRALRTAAGLTEQEPGRAVGRSGQAVHP